MTNISSFYIRTFQPIAIQHGSFYCQTVLSLVWIFAKEQISAVLSFAVGIIHKWCRTIFDNFRPPDLKSDIINGCFFAPKCQRKINGLDLSLFFQERASMQTPNRIRMVRSFNDVDTDIICLIKSLLVVNPSFHLGQLNLLKSHIETGPKP